MSKFNRKSNKGFTLIELMIVVAIIGILAAIAIPNFLRFQLKSKSSEGKVNIAAIRTAEESYLAEFGEYVPSGVVPDAVPGAIKATFAGANLPLVPGPPNPAPPTASNGFLDLGWSPEGQVFFQYAVTYTPATSQSAYTISAAADIDADGTNQFWGYVKPTTGTLAGIASADHGSCGANGVGAGQNQLATVGPCVSTSGQSVF